MGNINDILRRSSLVDTSGSEPPPSIQMMARLTPTGGVYTQSNDSVDDGSLLHGRISLGIIAAFIVGAVAFYIWTSAIQGGG